MIYRHRDLDTRVGTVDVAIPKLRSGTYFPLQARHGPNSPASPPRPPIVVTPAEELLVELRPSGEGVRVRVRNISDAPVTAEIRWHGGARSQQVNVGALGVADVVVPAATHQRR